MELLINPDPSDESKACETVQAYASLEPPVQLHELTPVEMAAIGGGTAVGFM